MAILFIQTSCSAFATQKKLLRHQSLKLTILFGMCFFFVFTSSAQRLNSKKTYYLDAIFIGKQKNTLAHDKAFVSFNTIKKTTKVYSSCNWITGVYQSKSTSFVFKNIKRGELPCPDYLDGLEADLLENLPKVNRCTIDKNKLYFFQNSDTLLIFHG
jgi:heat shock protein HslJ